jgi:hypothetical protein
MGKAGERRVDWFAAGLGLVLAVLIQIVGGALLFRSYRPGLLGEGLLTFAALLAGGFLAGYLGPLPTAVWNGMIVAVAFIIVQQLAGATGPIGPVGSAGMDMVALIVDDLIVLAGGTFGGLVAGGARRLRTR